MGKPNQKMIRLTQEELRKICEDAVDRGITKYLENEKVVEKERQSRLLHNTKVLLENYHKLKMYLENAQSELYDICEEYYPDYTIEALEVFGLRIDDKRSYTIAKGVAIVKIIMHHVDRMLEVYKTDCERSSSRTKQRRWEVLERLYIRNKRMATKEIAEELCLDIRVIQEDAKRAREDMKILLFGIEALFKEFEQQR